MRTTRAFAVALLALAIAAAAYAQSAAPAPAKLFAASSDVKAMIAKAKAERKPDQPNYVQPIVALAPINANLEYRAAGVNAPASVHEKDAELFYVVEGSGTLVTGGALKDERRTNPENLTGTGIQGGTSRKLGPGDFVMVPEKTPHWFTGIDGALVLMSVHIPH
jgi:mannose-6-phosphate isomerase-like protein (cupin superfamily)